MIQKLKYCYGITSETDDRLNHVFMMDFDGIGLQTVKDYLNEIQVDNNLSDIYIIESTNGYNAISLDKLPQSLIYNWGNYAYSPADRQFLKIGFERGYFVLRFGHDKKLVETLINASNVYEKSLAHKKFLEWFFDIKIICAPLDTNKKINLIRYPSEKHGYHILNKKRLVQVNI